MLYSNFYFVVQRYTTEIVVQYVWGIAIAVAMLFVTALMVDAQKDLPVDTGGVSRIWDLMRGRYEGIHGSAPVRMFYCCTGSDGTIRGCPDQPVRYDEGCIKDRSFEEICKEGFEI